MQRPPRILSIAGSDSSGGAGIQADIKTITMLGGYAMTAITAITAQNTKGVEAVEVLPAKLIGQQIKSCVDDIGIDAVKIGMLGSRTVIESVASALQGVTAPIVLDPVMVATSGASLASDDAVSAMRELLFPLATLITPNLPELEVLCDEKIDSVEDMAKAAESLSASTGTAVLAKGGHMSGDRIIDVLFVPDQRAVQFNHARIDSPHTHGTGCTLSSAIATLLGHKQSIEHAVRLGRRFVFEAIKQAPEFGQGNGPLGHQAVRNLD